MSDISLFSKFNFSNFSNLAFSNTFISDILFSSRFNTFNPLNSISHNLESPSIPNLLFFRSNLSTLVFSIFKLYFLLNSFNNNSFSLSLMILIIFLLL